MPGLTQKLAFEVGRSFPLYNLNNNYFGFMDNSRVGLWSHHDAERYLHHLNSLLNPLRGSKMEIFITLLAEFENNFLNFYHVGRDAGIFPK